LSNTRRSLRSIEWVGKILPLGNVPRESPANRCRVPFERRELNIYLARLDARDDGLGRAHARRYLRLGQSTHGTQLRELAQSSTACLGCLENLEKAGSRAVDSAIISERKSRLIRLSLQTVPDDLLLNLPHRRAGQYLHELDPLRHLESGEAFGTVSLDRL